MSLFVYEVPISFFVDYQAFRPWFSSIRLFIFFSFRLLFTFVLIRFLNSFSFVFRLSSMKFVLLLYLDASELFGSEVDFRPNFS